MVLDDPNAFIQTDMPPKKYGEERVIMKVKDVLVKTGYRDRNSNVDVSDTVTQPIADCV